MASSSGQSNLSRLERVFTLLENGASSVTRKAAAKQLGDVQKKHPHELNNLLAKLLVYIRHSEWDARIAAAEAIEAVVSHVPKWDPVPGVNTEIVSIPDEGKLTFQKLDIDKVLGGSQLLLGSSGDEYQLSIDTEGLDSKERVKKQRKMLEKRLGLTFGNSTLGVTSDDLFRDDDLLDSTALKKEVKEEIKEKCTNVISQFNKEMSSRERNLAKRKAKLMLKQQSKEGLKQDAKGGDIPAAKKRKKNESARQELHEIPLSDIPKHSSPDDWQEWPFNWICDEMINLLFCPCWESRHGACLALREIMKKHGGGSGRKRRMSKKQLIESNQLWLTDLSIRLLCVIALDRFADYISDQVVAPVRESCAQTLSVVVRFMEESHALEVTRALLHLYTKQEWEIRQSAMLALEYIIAVRKDLQTTLLPLCLPYIMQALHDKDGDVKSVAAKCLLPATELLTRDSSFELQLQALLKVLWDSLQEYDELVSSTQSILILLSKLIKVLPLSRICQADQPERLLARLWPFFHHALSTVREAALSTMISMLKDAEAKELSWLSTVCSDGLCNAFECCLLEAKPTIRKLAKQAYLVLIKKSPQFALLPCACNVPVWLALCCQPPLTPYEPDKLLGTKSNSKAGEGRGDKVIGGRLSSTQCIEEFNEYLMKTRENISELIGVLCRRVFQKAQPDNSYQNIIHHHLVSYMKSQSALHRIVAAMVVNYWWNAIKELPPNISDDLHSAVSVMLSENLYFSEVTTKFVQVQTDIRNLIKAIINTGVQPELLPMMTGYTFEDVIEFCTSRFPSLVSPHEKGLWDQRNLLLKLTEDSENMQLLLDCQVKSYSASSLINAVLASQGCPNPRNLPDKLNPIIRPLMECIKREENVTVRIYVSFALSRLIGLCTSRQPNPNDKLIKNLCSSLCSSSVRSPTSESLVQEFSDESLKSLHLSREQITSDGIITQLRRTEASMAEVNKKKRKNDDKVDQFTSSITACLGAEKCIQTLCEMYGSNLFNVVPRLWETVNCLQDSILCNSLEDAADESTMKITVSLVLFEVLIPAIQDSSLQEKLLVLLQQITSLVSRSISSVRFLSARCIAALTCSLTSTVMPLLVDQVVCNLDSAKNVYLRKGAIETVANVIERMGTSVVTYAVLLVVPLLGCMSDQDTQIRRLATHCFAQLIQYMQVESCIPDPPCLPESLIQRKNRERRFLEQLFDPRSLEHYEVPIPINATLRSYQEDGVKWLAFLNRYKLHGVLCDEMGLGKTLQTICIVASDHHYKEKQYQMESPNERIHLMSLVICPPTLTGHWVDEVGKFCSYLRPLQYAGPPQERARLRHEVNRHNLIIASYEVVRNDIDFFSKFKWNYCVLDEGHAIRNGKSKTAQCIKNLRSSHRLILTGTPIQNSVLELRSLFDFLIPGFLGSEQEFNLRFTKPILASRDAKCSSKEQEQGVLALEALHRQVLPFMMRRMKEDVLNDLPPKIIQDYYCDLSPLQLELYEDFANSRAKKEAESSINQIDKEKDQKPRLKETSHVFQALQYLQKVCNHPLLVISPGHPHYKPIMSKVNAQGSTLHDIRHATKLMALKQLLLDCGIGVDSESAAEQSVVSQHRALIFCQHRNMLDIIQNDLLASIMTAVTYLRLDGGIPANQRFSIVSRFNNDPSIDVLLLTTKVGGLGLNLTGADTVIFVEHDWNPMVDLQAMDRAHRIGQKKVVNVYRLITRGTLEEKILGLQKFKLNVANTVVGEDNRGLQSMGTNQVLELFSVDKESSPQKKKISETSSRGLRAMMEDLGELWDQNQYDDEYNLDAFIQNLAKK